MEKYELTEETMDYCGRTLHRIRALRAFGDVKTGDIGGFVEDRGNLDDAGNAWVYDNAEVYGNAKVYGDAEVCGNAKVYGNAEVCGDAKVCGDGDYAIAKGFGSEFRATTFFRLKGGSIGVRCGCFYGTLDDFRIKVRETYPEAKEGKEYLMLAELMEFHFGEA